MRVSAGLVLWAAAAATLQVHAQQCMQQCISTCQSQCGLSASVPGSAPAPSELPGAIPQEDIPAVSGPGLAPIAARAAGVPGAAVEQGTADLFEASATAADSALAPAAPGDAGQTASTESLQDTLALETITGVSSTSYWNANLSEFANAEPAPLLNGTDGNRSSIEAGQVTVSGKTISDGYQLLVDKQGVNDQRYFLSKKWSSSLVAQRKARYDALTLNVNPGVRRYNVFWHIFESGGVKPSTNASAVTCPKGQLKFPANETQRIQQGYTAYHCYDFAHIDDLDSYLALDAAYGIESAAIIWGCPAQFQNPNCTGNTLTGTIACAPTDASMYAWNDFLAFLTSRWGGGVKGRFTHFIIWNEVDSSTWFDMSPDVNDTLQHIENTPAADVYVARYVAMMRGAHNAIANNLANQPSMMYVSTDRMWTSSPWCPGPKWGSRCPLGTVNLLNGIWKMVGTSMDWSVVVHAYGNPLTTNWQLRQPYQAYTFSDLGYVTQFQQAWLRNLSVANPAIAPQAMLAASEQGWDTGSANQGPIVAQYVCQSHAVAVNASNNMVFVTHNDFQDVYSPYTGSYGVTPLAAGDYLNATGSYYSDISSFLNSDTISPTLRAMRATNMQVWGIMPNYCCTIMGLGCPGSTSTLASGASSPPASSPSPPNPPPMSSPPPSSPPPKASPPPAVPISPPPKASPPPAVPISPPPKASPPPAVPSSPPPKASPPPAVPKASPPPAVPISPPPKASPPPAVPSSPPPKASPPPAVPKASPPPAVSISPPPKASPPPTTYSPVPSPPTPPPPPPPPVAVPPRSPPPPPPPPAKSPPPRPTQSMTAAKTPAPPANQGRDLSGFFGSPPSLDSPVPGSAA